MVSTELQLMVQPYGDYEVVKEVHRDGGMVKMLLHKGNVFAKESSTLGEPTGWPQYVIDSPGP